MSAWLRQLNSAMCRCWPLPDVCMVVGWAGRAHTHGRRVRHTSSDSSGSDSSAESDSSSIYSRSPNSSPEVPPDPPSPVNTQPPCNNKNQVLRRQPSVLSCVSPSLSRSETSYFQWVAVDSMFGREAEDSQIIVKWRRMTSGQESKSLRHFVLWVMAKGTGDALKDPLCFWCF